MHFEASKSFGSAEGRENERDWTEKMFKRKNADLINNYDVSRQKCNFEIGPDGKLYPLGYNDKPLAVRLKERLDALGFQPFKEGAKNQPNCCAKFIFGGNHDRLNEMAWGKQDINFEKGADNSHLVRQPLIEQWAKDVYDWCAERYGAENVVGFQVHCDEFTPHIHALIVPVGRKKNGKEKVMYSAKFGNNKHEHTKIKLDMHTDLYMKVNSKYGLERGDSIEGRDVKHRSKLELIRHLQKEVKQLEKAIKGLTTMSTNLTAEIESKQQALINLQAKLDSGRITVNQYEDKKRTLSKEIDDAQVKLDDKQKSLSEKQEKLSDLSEKLGKLGGTVGVFKSVKDQLTAPQIKGTPPMFGKDEWVKEQNTRIAKEFGKTFDAVEKYYFREATKQVAAAKKELAVDYNSLIKLQSDNERLREQNSTLTESMTLLLHQLSVPSLRTVLLTVTDALIGGYPIPSSVGGGSDSSDLRWDGRNPKEDEDAYRLRCLMHASRFVASRSTGVRRRR